MSNFTSENEEYGIAEGSASARASTTSAMTLWQKFANWQNEMEECRSNVRNVQQQQEQCMAQISSLQAIRKEETMKIEQMQKLHRKQNDSSHGKTSLDMLQGLQRRLDEADKEYRIASTSLQTLQQQSTAQADQRHEAMHQILNQSRQFRWECQQVQLQLRTTVPAEDFLSSCNDPRDEWGVCKNAASTVHSLRAALCAILASKSENVGLDDSWMTKALQDSEFFVSDSVETEEEVDENDPFTWTFIRENDIDFQQVIADFKLERNAVDSTSKKLRVLQEKQEAIQSRARDRNQRIAQLQEQLHRLHGDCSCMEEEINRYQQLILDDEALAHTYREKIDQRNLRHSSATVNRRIGLNIREQDPLGASRQRPLSFPLPLLIPPIQVGQPKTNHGAKTAAPVKNPYAPSRKHSVEAAYTVNASCKSTESSARLDQTEKDLADVVLGRPSQRLKLVVPDANRLGAVSLELPEDSSAPKHRSRTFLNSLQFGCTLEVPNYASMDTDGDTAAGAVSKAAVDSFQECNDVDDSRDIFDDEDVLNFVAFPSSSCSVPE